MPLPVYLIHWDAPDWVVSATESVLNSDVEVAVTVVNNGPMPSGELVLGDRVRVVDTGANLGYAGGANVAVADALADECNDFLVVGSHDMHLDRRALGLMLEAAKEHPDAGILGPHLSTNWVAPGKGVDGRLDLREMVSGTCMLLRRACIEQIGAFDDLYGSYGEDDDLCARAWKAGWKVGRVQGATGHGLGTRTDRLRDHSYPNRVLLRYRTKGLAPALRMSIGHVRRAVASARRGDWDEARARARGAVIGLVKVVRAMGRSRRRRERVVACAEADG